MTQVMEPRAVRRDTDRRREAALETGGDEPEVPEAPTLALSHMSEPVLDGRAPGRRRPSTRASRC